jgi:2-dehydro-3-deoxyphosphogluconate aldolase / (4S)-4-hydroxy-2-oxoglutarate aldolase
MQRYEQRDWLESVKELPVIAVIRSSNLHIGRKMAQAVAAGGIKSIEITANSDRPWETISLLRAELPECSIGTGTVLNLTDLQNAIACGAEYLFTPHVDRSLIQAAIAANIPIVPGALTPTEIIAAWQAGATAVKVFPIQAVGGVDRSNSPNSDWWHNCAECAGFFSGGGNCCWLIRLLISPR